MKLYQYLSRTKKEVIMSEQLLRAGTAIGIFQKEGKYAENCSVNRRFTWLD